MSKLTGFVVSVVMLCMAGVARAAEIADVPVTEMNYTGILVFLGVFVGGCAWYLWRIMRNKGSDK